MGTSLAFLQAGCGGSATQTSLSARAAQQLTVERLTRIDKTLQGWPRRTLPTEGIACRPPVAGHSLSTVIREYDYPSWANNSIDVTAGVVVMPTAALARSLVGESLTAVLLQCVHRAMSRAVRAYRGASVTITPGIPSELSSSESRRGFTTDTHTKVGKPTLGIAVIFQDKADPRVVYDLVVNQLGRRPTAITLHILKAVG